MDYILTYLEIYIPSDDIMRHKIVYLWKGTKNLIIVNWCPVHYGFVGNDGREFQIINIK